MAAASLGTHLLTRGYSVRLVTDEGGSASTAWHDRSEGPGSAEGQLLEALATVEASTRASIGTVRSLLHGAGTSSGLVVAVLGAMTADEVMSMARLRHDTAAALAVVLDAAAWPGGGHPGLGAVPAEAASATLSRAGWHTVVVGTHTRSSDALASAWALLGENAASGLPVAVGMPS